MTFIVKIKMNNEHSYYLFYVCLFVRSGIKMQLLLMLFGAGEYSSRICSWILAAYFGENYLIWVVVGVDFVSGIIAEITKLGDIRLISLFDFLTCFRMYDSYLFYGNKFDCVKYLNFKEFERFVLQLMVVIYSIWKMLDASDTSIFFWILLYICWLGMMINLVYNLNRLLFKKDSESEVITVYKQMINNL